MIPPPVPAPVAHPTPPNPRKSKRTNEPCRVNPHCRHAPGGSAAADPGSRKAEDQSPDEVSPAGAGAASAAPDRRAQYLGGRSHPPELPRGAQRWPDGWRSRRRSPAASATASTCPRPRCPGQRAGTEKRSHGCADFRPYLTQILATIAPQLVRGHAGSVKLGRRGNVGLYFAIAKSGTVAKVIVCL